MGKPHTQNKHHHNSSKHPYLQNTGHSCNTMLARAYT